MVKGTENTAAKQRSQVGIGWVVTVLLIASAVALGLKAWDDHQTNTEAALINTQLTALAGKEYICLLYTSPSPRDQRGSRMPSSA